jgi:hypothetical protein
MIFGLACLVVLLYSTPTFGAARGPSTAEERAKAVELVELLETSPSATGAKQARAWLITWLTEVPDITVTVCLDLLGPAEERDDLPGELLLHPMFAQAAFLIRNPEAAGDSQEAFAAAVEGTIRIYDAMREAGSVEPQPVLEELKRKQAAGELAEVVRKRSEGCRQP